IGIVNSARIAASFVGPVVATSVLAVAAPAVVYGLLAAGGAACLPLVALRGPADRRATAPAASFLSLSPSGGEGQGEGDSTRPLGPPARPPPRGGGGAGR